MKKTVSLLVALCLLLCGTSIGASAADANDGTYVFFYDGDIEVTVEGNGLSYEKIQRIADFVAEVEPSDDGIAPCGLACLFGHKYETTYTTKTIHNAFPSSPKCVMQKYEVKTCTRCGEIEKTLIETTYISTCHG